ncbi:MAG: substrate-binding domain-containing protein [Terriglobales bacterium]
MTKLNLVVSLITDNNDYQQEQAAAAEEAARRLNTSLQIVYAGNDAVNQTQQLLKVIQNPAQRPDAILVEPVGTGMPQVAAAATAANISWGVLNREVDYVAKLRMNSRVTVFAITTVQEEVGRIQGRQLAALLPNGGGVLYIEGPSGGEVARLRTSGMNSTKPGNVNLKVIKGDWTEGSGYRSVKSWLSLSTSVQLHIRAMACQNDAMGVGARRAFEEVAEVQARKNWLSLPFIGCDGVPKTGLEWVRRGLLAATVVIPPTMGLAFEIMTRAIRSGVQPPARILSQPSSFPALKDIAART